MNVGDETMLITARKGLEHLVPRVDPPGSNEAVAKTEPRPRAIVGQPFTDFGTRPSR